MSLKNATYVFLVASITIGALALITSVTHGEENAVAGGLDLTWHTVDGGGGTASGGGFTLSGTIGQPDASPAMAGGTFQMLGGFWPGVNGEVEPACLEDCADSDGIVGTLDLLAMLGAWGGDGPCDLDGDNFIGTLDLLALLGAWGGCP